MKTILCSLLICSALTLSVSAQFFFDQMFGHHQQQQQQHRPPSGESQWAAQADHTACSQYLCPTLACVATPVECPCPAVEDVKCVIPDGEDSEAATVVCIRGGSDCAQIDRLMSPSWAKKK